MGSNLRPDTARPGAGRKRIPVGPLLPCVNDLEPGEDGQLGGQQSSAEMNKIASPTDSRSPDCLHRQIHMLALVWMERPMMQTLCLFAPPPRPPTILPTTSPRHSTFLTTLPRCLYSTVVRKTIRTIEHLFNMNLACRLQNRLAQMELSSFRMAPTLMRSQCDARPQSLSLSRGGENGEALGHIACLRLV